MIIFIWSQQEERQADHSTISKPNIYFTCKIETYTQIVFLFCFTDTVLALKLSTANQNSSNTNVNQLLYFFAICILPNKEKPDYLWVMGLDFWGFPDLSSSQIAERMWKLELYFFLFMQISEEHEYPKHPKYIVQNWAKCLLNWNSSLLLSAIELTCSIGFFRSAPRWRWIKGF